jgi:hypothetical protein
MKCQEVQERVSAYLDDELDSALHQGMANHLNQCARCREELDGFQGVDALLKGLARLDVGPEFAEHLVVGVCKESVASERMCFEGGVSNPVLRFFESFFELLGPARSRRTRSLEEFDDFPPLSIGYLYCRILGQC